MASDDTTLPTNPLKEFTTYATHFTLKLGRDYNGKSTGKKNGYEDAKLIFDSRGSSDVDNNAPALTVQSFEISHRFSGEQAKVTVGLDGTLVVYERGGCSYLHTLGTMLAEMGIATTGSAILWVGVSIVGWTDTGSAFNSTTVSEKWFPCLIKKIDMTMRNSGSEYTHWIIGMDYAGGESLVNEHLNIKETIGNTVADHLDDLIKNANTEMKKAKAENTKGSSAVTFKEVEYFYTMDETLQKTAPIEVSTASYDTGGIKHISSGGKNGSTTITAHVKEILKHAPLFLEDITNKNTQFKIITSSSEVTDEKEKIEIRIIPYLMVPKDKQKPLMRLNYFYGGVNEDILDFSFELDGAFELIRQNLVTTTNEDINPDASRAVAQNTRNIEATKTPTTPDSGRAEDSSETSKTSQDQTDIEGSVTAPKPIKSNFGNDMNRQSANAWGKYNSTLEDKMGLKLVQNNIKIRGNPHLILDATTIEEYGLETVANMVVLNIGTPLPEFQDDTAISDAPTETFIFSGNYRISGVKSIFNASGTFEQEIDMAYIPNKR